MMILVVSLGLGAAVGAALGYFGQCSSGTCPLTATWWRGALFGAAFGLIFYLGSGRDIAGARELAGDQGPVQPVTAANFEERVVRAETPVVVDFYATWCGPCKRLAPTLSKLAGEYAGRIQFVKVDVDRERALAARFEVTSVPTLMWFAHGRAERLSAGLESEAALRARLDGRLKSSP
jgi:thioredoxin